MKAAWFAALFCGALSLTPSVHAADYPDHPVKFIVGFAAGSGPDVITRTVGTQLTTDLGQAFYVQNQAGANGTVAIRAVATSPADGYTLLYSSASIASVPYLYKNPNFDVLKDLVPIATSGVLDGNLVLVQPSLPVSDMKEFVDYARTHKLFYGSPGYGNGLHLATALFNERAGIEMDHVPFRGASEVTAALLAGNVQVMFVTPPSVIALVQSGMLKAIGYTGAKPFPELPKVPLVKDSVPTYPVQGSWGIFFAPKGTPKEIVTKLNVAIRAALKQPAVANVVQKSGYEPDERSPEATAEFFKAEIEATAEAVKAAKIKPE